VPRQYPAGIALLQPGENENQLHSLKSNRELPVNAEARYALTGLKNTYGNE
jgi:hypothetical protein